MMRVAIPTWSGTISPVFDVARSLLLADVEAGREVRRREEPMSETGLAARATHVATLGVDVLICGAISQPLEMMLVSKGIQVIPHTCGPVEHVLQAYLSGRLLDQAYLMPGCHGRRRRMRGRADRHGFGRR